MAPKNTVIQSKDLKEKRELLGSKKVSVGKKNSGHKSCYPFQEEGMWMLGVEEVATKAYAHHTTFLCAHAEKPEGLSKY